MTLTYIVVAVVTAIVVNREGKADWRVILRVCWPLYLLAFLGLYLVSERNLYWAEGVCLLGLIPVWFAVKKRQTSSDAAGRECSENRDR